MDINIESQIVVQTAAQWAVDTTVYSAKRILVTSDALYTGTDQRKFKIPDGVQTWANLDYFPDPASLATAAENNAKAYADALVVGLWDDRGNFDASGNAYPNTGGSGTAGAILKGDIWTVSVAGTLPTGQVVSPGDTVRALIDTPGNTQSNWAIAENNIGYVAENSANKDTDVTLAANSDTKYPSQKATKTYVDEVAKGAYYLGNNTFNPADGLSYYFCHLLFAPSTTSTARRFKFAKAGSVKNAEWNISQTNNGSNETVTIYLRNVTTSTDYQIGTFTSDFGASTVAGFSFTGLDIDVNTTDDWTIKVVCPTWSANPTAWLFTLTLLTS